MKNVHVILCLFLFMNWIGTTFVLSIGNCFRLLISITGSLIFKSLFSFFSSFFRHPFSITVSLICKSLFSLFRSFFTHVFLISSSFIRKSACPLIGCFCIFDSFQVISVLEMSTLFVFIGF